VKARICFHNFRLAAEPVQATGPAVDIRNQDLNPNRRGRETLLRARGLFLEFFLAWPARLRHNQWKNIRRPVETGSLSGSPC
jgi:hypothetical protein